MLCYRIISGTETTGRHRRQAHLAIELGVFVEGVVELLGTLLQSQRQRGFGTFGPGPVFKVPLLKQGPKILGWTQRHEEQRTSGT